jgi:hypothetical protein
MGPSAAPVARGGTTMSRRGVRGKRRRRATKPAAVASPAAVELDALLPEAALAGAQAAGGREPPRLIVEPPERLAARRARDQRDGVRVADPRRRGLYLGIAVFVAVVLLVFAVLSLIESRDVMPSLFPSP